MGLQRVDNRAIFSRGGKGGTSYRGNQRNWARGHLEKESHARSSRPRTWGLRMTSHKLRADTVSQLGGEAWEPGSMGTGELQGQASLVLLPTEGLGITPG